jgi:hypothetical protein
MIAFTRLARPANTVTQLPYESRETIGELLLRSQTEPGNLCYALRQVEK